MAQYATDVDYRAMTATVVRDTRSGYNYTGSPGRRMAIYSEDGQISLNFDVAPREISFDGLTWEWAQLDRVGFVAKMVPKWGKLRTMSFETTLTRKYDMFGDIQRQFDDLRRLCRSTQRVMCRYSRQEVGSYVITEASFKSVLREPVTNEITRATLNMTLTEANEGPDIGAGVVWYRAMGAGFERPDNNGRPRIDVRPGDTLQSLALRAYGDVGDWPWIYALNADQLGTPWADLRPYTTLVI